MRTIKISLEPFELLLLLETIQNLILEKPDFDKKEEIIAKIGHANIYEKIKLYLHKNTPHHFYWTLNDKKTKYADELSKFFLEESPSILKKEALAVYMEVNRGFENYLEDKC